MTATATASVIPFRPSKGRGIALPPNVTSRYRWNKRGPKAHYFYFQIKRNGRAIVRESFGPGVRPWTAEFNEKYEEFKIKYAHLLQHAVVVRCPTVQGATLEAVIRNYKARCPEYRNAKQSTRDVYDGHFRYLIRKLGDLPFAAITTKVLKALRDKRVMEGNEVGRGKGGLNAANTLLKRFRQLWRWAEEYPDLAGLEDCPLTGEDPTLKVKRMKEKPEAAKVWPAALCAAFAKHPRENVRTLYYLLRYTGQRRGDCGSMTPADIDLKRGKINIMQEKTGTRVWLPIHKRLRAYLATLDLSGRKYIIQSNRGDCYSDTALTNLVVDIAKALGFPGYTPHGLRHLAGARLAEAGCSENQIMSVLGHVTTRMAQHYVRQARRDVMAEEAMAKLETYDDADAYAQDEPDDVAYAAQNPDALPADDEGADDDADALAVPAQNVVAFANKKRRSRARSENAV